MAGHDGFEELADQVERSVGVVVCGLVCEARHLSGDGWVAVCPGRRWQGERGRGEPEPLVAVGDRFVERSGGDALGGGEQDPELVRGLGCG